MSNNSQCKNCVMAKEAILYEGEYSYVILSNPAFCLHHFLVLPKKHRESLAEVTTEERKDMDAVTVYIIDALKDTYPEYTDFVLWENEGPHRSVSHYHRHIIPNNGKEPFVVSIHSKEKKTDEILQKEIEHLKKILFTRN